MTFLAGRGGFLSSRIGNIRQDKVRAKKKELESLQNMREYEPLIKLSLTLHSLVFALRVAQLGFQGKALTLSALK